jgi:RNA polymerase sigma-70 factor (ECF subfamily)
VSSTPLSSDRLGSRRTSPSPDGAAAERQLARWIAEGDDAAFGELIDLLVPTLYTLALGITQDPERAQEAVEESFAELWEKRAWLGRLPALSPWMVERCRTWAIALRSGTAPPPARPLQDRAGDVPLTRRLLRCPPSIRASRLGAALDQLPAVARQALVLASRAGLGQADIAARLEIPPEKVPSVLRSGLHQLREGLGRSLRREAP